jgi:hypothetical protein
MMTERNERNHELILISLMKSSNGWGEAGEVFVAMKEPGMTRNVSPAVEREQV